MGEVLDNLLERYAERVATRRVVIEPGAVSRLGALLKSHFDEPRKFLVLADANTWDAAGRAVASALEAEKLPFQTLILEPRRGQAKLHPDERLVEQTAERLRETGALGLAVGAGTINDVTKAASFNLDRPYAVVATAPSMNGWTSAIAAVVVNGLKMTLSSRAPVLVVGDLDILARAPERMVGAGFADLTAKWVAAGDWRLADRLVGSGYDPEVEEISKAAIELLDGWEEGVAERRPEALERLMEALCISGLSMAVAGSSAHISGAEHLFSHYIDMMLPEVSERELHGRQVGIGTLCSAALYEQLLRWSPDDLDIEACIASRPPWEMRRKAIERHFGHLASVVIGQVTAIPTEGPKLRARLERLVSLWPELREELAEAVAPRALIEEKLRKAGAPTHYGELGLDGRQAVEILEWAGDIRNRYTILHLAAEIGRLQWWARDAIGRFGQK